MDTKRLFQTISRKMRADFDASAQIQHAGSKGTMRESILRQFLANGRLPEKYGIASGEVVGRTRETSRQSDLIVYDRLNGVALLYDDSVQVFPIDCVYGIVEVKSALSKSEFLDALEKIRCFKEMSPGGTAQQAVGAGWSIVRSRPRPFGMVFAYNLAGNSLESLVENLRTWEAEHSPSVWPNYVCVLETGTIYHSGKPFEKCIDSDQITSKSWPMSISFAEDSLFQFFCAVHDSCSRMQLGPVELSHYYDPALRIGNFVVYGRGVEGELFRPGSEGKKVRITAKAIERVVTWCESRSPILYGDYLKMRVGSIPLGMDDSPVIKQDVHLYNPENLPGIGGLRPGDVKVEDGRLMIERSLLTAIELQINGKNYVIAGLTDADYEEV